mgnify:CR=1 FL=1
MFDNKNKTSPKLDTKLVSFTDEIKEKDKQVARYNLAKGSERIWARIIDFLITIAICAGIFCMVFLINKPEDYFEPYRYLIFAVLKFVINFCYFVVLQRVWKGQTLGMKAFKLATYNQLFSHFTWNIIKKELLIWMLLGAVELSLGILLCIVGYANDTTGTMNAWNIVSKMFTGDSSTKIYTVIYGALFAICGILLIFVAVDTGIHSQRQSFSDRFSNTCVVKKVDMFGNKDNNNQNLRKTVSKRNYALPGAVLNSPHDTIDSLDEKENKEEK